MRRGLGIYPFNKMTESPLCTQCPRLWGSKQNKDARSCGVHAAASKG